MFDPGASNEQAQEEYEVELIEQPIVDNYDAVILAVAHDEFIELGVEQVKSYLKPDGILYDLKYVFDADAVDLRL